MSAPWARFVASSVWRTRRMTPLSSIALMRSMTTSTGTPQIAKSPAALVTDVPRQTVGADLKDAVENDAPTRRRGTRRKLLGKQSATPLDDAAPDERTFR